MIKRTFLADRAIYSFAAVAMLLALVIPGVFPAFASAAQLQSRAMKLSNATAGATSVDYELTFTPQSNISSGGGFVIDFCSDSPLVGQSCARPTGFDASSATADTGTVTPATATLKLALGSAATAGTPVTVTFSGIDNPTGPNTSLYARVTTYDDGTALATYSGPLAANLGTYTDEGGIAMSIVNAIGVTAAVREKLTFCVSGVAPGPGCGTTGQAVTNPSLELGEGTSPKALDSSVVSTNTDDYVQIATNASGGAVVRMKSSNPCAGLHRTSNADQNDCEIKAVNDDGGTTAAAIVFGNPLFGMRVGTITNLGVNGTVAAAAPYDGAGSGYGMVKDAANGGVNSPYGDDILNTSGAPTDDTNANLEFAASISNSTPAGIYTATLNLIATGTF